MSSVNLLILLIERMNCIVLLRPKLIGTDDILPFFFELKHNLSIKSLMFVCPNKDTYDLIEKNKVIYDAILSIEGELTYINRSNNKLFRIITNIFILNKYLRMKIVSFENGVYHSRLASILTRINKRAWGGKSIFIYFINFPYRIAIQRMKRVWVSRGKSAPITLQNFDYALLSNPKEEFYETHGIKIPACCPAINVGFTRGMKSWQDYLHRNATTYLGQEVSTPYFFFPLGNHGSIFGIPGYVDRDVLFIECLEILSEFSQSIQTVFKPSALTQIERIHEILDSINYKNYVISYAHPMMLMTNASFLLTNGASTLIRDAYFIGCPTIEYSDFGDAIHKLNGEQSANLDFVDYYIYRDAQRLKEVVQLIIHHEHTIRRDPVKMKEDLPVLSAEKFKERLQFLSE